MIYIFIGLIVLTIMIIIGKEIKDKKRRDLAKQREDWLKIKKGMLKDLKDKL